MKIHNRIQIRNGITIKITTNHRRRSCGDLPSSEFYWSSYNE